MLTKQECRKRLLAERASLCEQRYAVSQDVLQRVLQLDVFQSAKLVLCYVSLPDEIDTEALIEQAWRSGKEVAVPVCTDRFGNMDFYRITALSDLKNSTFGVREPDTALCQKVTDFQEAVCIVPGLSFDRKGSRLGYGKGYYDRFLKKYTLISIGLCYNSLILDTLPTDEFDVPVNIVVTEQQCFGG